MAVNIIIQSMEYILGGPRLLNTNSTVSQVLCWALKHVLPLGIVLPRRYWVFLTYEDPD